jgi:Holliday junction resolvase
MTGRVTEIKSGLRGATLDLDTVSHMDYTLTRSKHMAQTPEGKVKAKIVAALKEEGVYYFYPATGGFGRSGVPDIVCCVAGKFLAIECKAGKNKPTALQVNEIERIRRAGGVAVVANEENWDMVRELVRTLKGGPT